jgi:hypothetical protein
VRIDSVTINWNEVNRIERTEFMRRIDAAAITVQREMIRLTTLVDGANRGTRTRNAKTGKFQKGKLRYGARRSKPGESPYKQTGQLSQSIAIERRPETLTARIGPGVMYGSYLELGMNRPFIRLSLTNKTNDVRRILSQ